MKLPSNFRQASFTNGNNTHRGENNENHNHTVKRTYPTAGQTHNAYGLAELQESPPELAQSIPSPTPAGQLCRKGHQITHSVRQQTPATGKRRPWRRSWLGTYYLDECSARRRVTSVGRTGFRQALQRRNEPSQALIRSMFGSRQEITSGRMAKSQDLERGAAVVDFVLVSALLAIMFMALIQMALVLHVRNTVADAASSAARYGALADRTAADAQQRAEVLLSSSLGPDYAKSIVAEQTTHNSVPTIQVTVTAPWPVIGLLGIGGELKMSGHAAIQ